MIKFEYIKEEIKDQYLLDNRPWIIGFSGGKDSTTLLQVVWYALREIPQKRLNKKVYVVSNDTLVENPIILKFLNKTLKKIRIKALKEN